MSLRLRTIAGIAAIEIVLLIVLVVSSLTHLKASNEELFLQRSQIAKKLFATMAADPVIAFDLATLEAFLQNALQNEEIIYIRVRGSNGRVLAQGGSDQALSSAFKQTATLEAARLHGRFDAAQAIEVSGTIFGQIEMGLSLASTEAAISSATAWLLTISAIEVVLVALFSFLLGTMLTRRIDKLRRAARAVAAGDFGVQVNDESADEVGEFSRDFNRMSVAMEQHSVELRKATRAAEEARQIAEEESSSKGKFLALMSHEIRTPMNAVIGLSSALQERQLSGEDHHLVNTINTESNNLLRILNDILDYSKMDAGQLSLEDAAFSPKDITENIINLTAPRGTAKGLKIETAFDPDLPETLIGDAGRIRQILLNLVSNAIKFTSSGHVTVHISCSRKDATIANLIWRVEDSGIGIARDKIGNLFSEFVQADKSINRLYGGTGLGLAISKGLVTKMGGELSIDSEEGRGTSVTVSLALPISNTVAIPDIDIQVSAENLRQGISDLGRPAHILAVDDNQTNLLVIEQLLRGFNIRIALAHDGAEAVIEASRERFDFILMDIRMPELDGLEATKIIRKGNGPNTATPIIAFTANAFSEDIEAAHEAGMDDFMVKPIRKNALVEALLQALQPTSGEWTTRKKHDHTKPDTDDELTPIPTNKPDLDTSLLDELVSEIGAPMAVRTIESFLSESTKRLDTLQNLSLASDQEEIRREAHSIKGIALTFGLQCLSGQASWLEQNAKMIDEADYDNIIDVLVASNNRAAKALLQADVLASSAESWTAEVA